MFDPLSDMPPESRVRHAMHLTPGARPVMKRPYRLSASQKESAEKQILAGFAGRMVATIDIRVGNGDLDGAQEGQHMANVCRL